MSLLRIEVKGFRICEACVPYSLFIISVHSDEFNEREVFRRFQSFIKLRQELMLHYPSIQSLPIFDENNFNNSYLHIMKVFFDGWLESLRINADMLRIQAMNEFLSPVVNKQPRQSSWIKVITHNQSSNIEMDMDMNEIGDDNFPNQALTNRALSGDPKPNNSSFPIIQNVRWNRCKILIVGPGRAGKTALANNLMGEWIPDTPSTIGAEKFDVKLYYGVASSGKIKKVDSPEFETEALLAEGLLKSPNSFSMETSGISNDEFSHEDHLPQNFKLISNEINHDKVIQYKELFEMEMASKYKLTLIDFGGQSIFNVLHAFFMSKYSIYLLVFDMDLFLSNNEQKRQSCHREMKFWIDTIALHACDNTNSGKVAPIAIVGTKGDVIVTKEQYREISEQIQERYEQNPIWDALIWFEGSEELDGERFCFFPNNNTLTEGNAVRSRLVEKIENTLDQSDQLKKLIPVVWIKIFDEMKSMRLSCLSYDQVIAITKNRFLNRGEKELEVDIIMIFVENMLRYLNNLGMILWIEEKSLRDIIILDPIDYFVKPATTIICNYWSDDVKIVHEISEIHGKSKKEHEKDWKIMLESGMVSEVLVRDLLKRFYQTQKINDPEVLATRTEKILLLMEQYGLAVALDSTVRFIPALLPDDPTQVDTKQKKLAKRLDGSYQRLNTPFSIGTHYSLYCHVPVKKVIEARIFPVLSDAELSQQGFLPTGLFERFVCRCLQALILCEDQLIEKIDGIVSIDGHLVENRLICGFCGKVEFSYNCHRIRMINRLEENRIEVIIELHEKVARDKEEALFLTIYKKTSDVMGTLLRESYSRLAFSTLIHPEPCASSDQSIKGSGLITLRKVSSLLQHSNEISELVQLSISSEDEDCTFVLVAQDMKRSLYWSVWREEEKDFPLLKGAVPNSPINLLHRNGKSTHVFLSHDWGVDGANHQKIKLVGEALAGRGLKVWIDDGLDEFGKRRITTELPQTIYAAIENTSCMLIFITENYLNKVNGEDITDYCQREFLFGFRQLGRRMIPIIMDSNVFKLFKEKKTLGGLIGGHLEGFLYYDMSSVFGPSSSTLNEEMYRSIEELFARIVNLIDISSCSK